MYSQGIVSPIETIGSFLPGLLQLQGLLLLVLVFVGGAAFIFGSDKAGVVFKLVPFGIVLMVGGYGVLWMRSAAGHDELSAPAGLGVFDWIGEHWLTILGVLVALSIAGVSTYRIVTTRQLLHQVKLDMRAVLATIDLADVTEARWKDSQLQGNPYMAKHLAALPGLRKELLTILAQVHAGDPLPPKQRGRMEEIRRALSKDKQTA